VPPRDPGLLRRYAELRFHAGAVVEVDAEEGAETVRAQMASDEGARFLGEVALVDGDSRVGRTGLTFGETLLDENAASHLAYGAGLPRSVEGAADLDDAGLRAAGVNASTLHLDVVVGGPDVDVDGVTPAGRTVPLLRGDRWQLD
jgi:aminopeptidase